MQETSLELVALGWVLTYALHSTALLGLAWWVARRCRPGPSRARELVWRTALFGGLVTASLQTALDLDPLGGRLTLQEAAALERSAQDSDAGPAGAAPVESPPTAARSEPARRLAPRGENPLEPGPRSAAAPSDGIAASMLAARQLVQLTLERNADAPAEPSAPTTREPRLAQRRAPRAPVSDVRPRPPALAPDLPSETLTPTVARIGAATARGATWTLRPPARAWRGALLFVWLVGGSLGVVLLALAFRRLADRLAGRRSLAGGALHAELVALCTRAGRRRVPRLCSSSRLRTPATVGVLAPQICVPERALTELTPSQQRAMLAHELAHVARRDPLWSFLGRLVERALFFQPLNRVARRELAVLAEYEADAWAVAQTGRGLELARCLAEVAGWLVPERQSVALLPMAARGSLLGSRIRHLLDEEDAPSARPHRRFLGAAAAGLALAACALVVPGAAARRLVPPDAARVVDPSPEPAAEPSPSPEPGARELPDAAAAVEQMLDELDLEVAELLGEIEELDQTLESTGLSSTFREPIGVLRGRVDRLRASKTRLEALVPAVLERLDAESPPAADAQDHSTRP